MEMYNDVLDLFRNGETMSIVFDCPVPGFWHLAHILEINSHRWVAKSEVIFVLTKPTSKNMEVDCGTIIIPRLDSIRCIKSWAETYLERSYQEVLGNILKIQELQLKNYKYQMGLLEHSYRTDAARPFAHQIYELQGKIRKVHRATELLRSVISVSERQ